MKKPSPHCVFMKRENGHSGERTHLIDGQLSLHAFTSKTEQLSKHSPQIIYGSECTIHN